VNLRISIQTNCTSKQTFLVGFIIYLSLTSRFREHYWKQSHIIVEQKVKPTSWWRSSIPCAARIYKVETNVLFTIWRLSRP